MFVLIMFMGGIYYELYNFFSFLFPNIYISSCIACLYVFMLEIKFDLIHLASVHVGKPWSCMLIGGAFSSMAD